MLSSLRSVWMLTEGARSRYAAAIAAMVVASCFLYLAPLVPQAVIDGVLVPSTAPRPALVDAVLAVLGGPEFVGEHLWVAAIAMVALTAVAGVFTYLRTRWSAQASEDTVRRLRDRTYDHLQRLPCDFFDTSETGDLLQRCTSDVETVRLFLANHVVEIGRALIMFAVPLPVMYALDPKMTAVAVALIPLITAWSTLFFLRVRSAFKEADEAEGRLTSRIQENLTGIRVVRAFARQAHEEEVFAERNQAHRSLDYRLYRLMAVFWSISDLLTFAQQALVVGAGISWVWRGELAVGAFFYFLTAVGMFMYPLRQMGRIVADLGKATVAIGRVRQILDSPAEPADAGAVLASEGEVVFDGVSFRYGTGDHALNDLSLTIPARSTVAFVGPSGSGKSTLVALLLRLYDVQEGSIRLDGRELRDLDRRALRRQLAVVLQQPFLFSRSVLENLRLGRGEATVDEVVDAARVAHVHEAIAGFEDGYDTHVGERGVTLSGGQRQRLALARALLRRPAVLVLDDALSAVDTATETAILRRLAERKGRQTTVLIAHRLTTVALADRIFVLDGGRLVQSGDHHSLLARDGPYRRLWNLQTEDAPLEELA